jgi:outer membrane receptor protein involved in Fe transport
MPQPQPLSLRAQRAAQRPPCRPWLLAAAVACAFPALAQTTAAPAAQPVVENAGEIVVTARRIEERLQDVPLSIRALTGKDLKDRSITSLSELSTFTPGLSYSADFGRTQERPVIRGISALRPEAPQPVSVFIDGIFVRDGALSLGLDDAAQVEVIKGPQSALYGRATYAGAINYTTVRPGNELKGTVTGTWASATERSAFGAVSVPIQKDVLAARVRAKHFEYGGQYTNTLTGNKIGNEKTDAGGLTVFLTPTANFDATLSIDTSRDNDGIFAAVARTVPTQAGGVVTSQNGSTNIANGAVCDGKTINIVGNNAQGIPDPTVAPTAANRLNGWPCGAATFSGTALQRNEADLASYIEPGSGTNYGNIAGLRRTITRSALTLNYLFGNGYLLTSQSAYTSQNSALGADQSYNGTRFAITGASWLSYDRDVLKYGSQEVRLSSPLDKPLTWMVGAFLYHEDGTGVSTSVIARNAQGVVVADTLRPKSASRVTNTSPFARVQYQFDKSLRVSAEGRINRETIEVGGTALGTAIVTAGTCVAGQVCFVNGKKSSSDFSPRVTLDYKSSSDQMFYVQAATGSKSGGFNTTPGLTSDVFAYNGEKVKSYEAGVKTLLLDRKLGINAAVFRNDIDNLQLSNVVTVTNPLANTVQTTTIVNNVGKARTQGLELEVSARTAQWLTLSGNYAFTDAKAREGTEITNGTVFGGNRSVNGFTLPRTPKHSAALSVAVEQGVGGGGTVAFGRVDVVYQSRRYAEVQNLIWADPFTRINGHVGVRGKNWRATLWVKNAANDDTSLNGFRYLDPVTFRRSAVDFLPRLRQYGLTAAYDF